MKRRAATATVASSGTKHTGHTGQSSVLRAAGDFMINYVVAEAGAFGFRYFIEDRAQHCARMFRIHTFESIARESRLPSGTWVIATDQLLPAERLVMAEICDQLISRGGPAIRVLNHPAHVLNRFTLLDTLYRSGRSRFRAVRASESFEQLRYPVFVREAVDHTGSLTPLLRDPHEVRQALLRLALRGLSRRDLLVVEFCDTADPNGVFRKYSAYVVGERVIPRCVDCDKRWMLKFNPGAFTPERIAAELAYVRSNPHEAMLAEVFSLARTQYGRLDYSLVCDSLQVWEINLNPCIGRGRPLALEPAENKRSRELRGGALDLFYSRFLAAWEELDAATCPGDDIEVRVDAKLWEAARVARARWQWGERHRRLVLWAERQRLLGALWRQVRPAVHRGIARWRR